MGTIVGCNCNENDFESQGEEMLPKECSVA